MPNLIVSAVSTFDNRGLKKGQKDISAFDKQTQKLGQTFNRVFAATAIVAFSKKAISAFASDEAAARSLAVQLQNTGNAFRVDEVETYIAKLQNLYKVLDDQLRPAFQTLLNVTGSVTLSQEALETALNVSAGTGASLETVINAISAGVRGNTKAIKSLNTGIDANIIKTGDMNKIMAALEKRFTGAALARLDTYAGKMDALKVAAADAAEIIGAGLLDALSALGKDNSIDQAANSMNGFAIAIANTARGMGDLIAQVKQIVDSDVGKFLLGLTALLTLGKKQLILGAVGLIAYDIGKPQPSSNFTYGSGNPRADLVLQKKLNSARKEEYKLITSKNEVDKLKDKFDTERIGLMKALAEATDAETKLRIQAKIAILDNNEALAKKYNAELEASNSARALAESANNAANALNTLPSKYDAIFTSLVNTFKTMGLDSGAAAGLAGMSARLQAQADAMMAQIGQYTVPGGMPSSATTAATTTTVVPQVTVNTGAVLTSEQDLTRYIQDAVATTLKGGGGLGPAGSIIVFQ